MRNKIPHFIHFCLIRGNSKFQDIWTYSWHWMSMDCGYKGLWLLVYSILSSNSAGNRVSFSDCFFYWFTIELLNNNSVSPLGRQHAVVKRELDEFLEELSLRPLEPTWALAHVTFQNLSFNICKMGSVLSPSLSIRQNCREAWMRWFV